MTARQSPGLGSGSSVVGYLTSWFTLTLHLPPLQFMLWGVVDQDTAPVVQSSRDCHCYPSATYTTASHTHTTSLLPISAFPERSVSNPTAITTKFPYPTHSTYPTSSWPPFLLPLLLTDPPLLLLMCSQSLPCSSDVLCHVLCSYVECRDLDIM